MAARMVRGGDLVATVELVKSLAAPGVAASPHRNKLARANPSKLGAVTTISARSVAKSNTSAGALLAQGNSILPLNVPAARVSVTFSYM